MQLLLSDHSTISTDQHQTLSDPQQSTSTNSYLIPAHKPCCHGNRPMNTCLILSGVFYFCAKQYLWTNCPVCLRTPKSSSSLLTRLDNPVLKAGILFVQWLLSALIASDLMRDCRLLVDSGDWHSVKAMVKQHRITKQGWALVPVITDKYQLFCVKRAAINIICCLNYSNYRLCWFFI